MRFADKASCRSFGPINIDPNASLDEDLVESLGFKCARVKECPELSDVMSDLMSLDSPIMYLRDSDSLFLGFALPAVFFPDVYIAEKDGEVLLSRDIVSLAKAIGVVDFDQNEIDWLMVKGYCHPDKTPFKQISRPEGYCFYTFDPDGSLRGSRLPFGDTRFASEYDAYEGFKKAVNQTVDRLLDENGDREHVLLLSGGADSRLLLLLLKDKGVDFQARTSVSAPLVFEDNAKDAIRAEQLSASLGVAHKIEVFDYENNRADYIEPAVPLMPCCPHTLTGFISALSDLPQGDVVIWTGQNMDSLYNLGPTGRVGLNKHGIASFFKRFFISDGYIKTLPDVTGGVFAMP